MPAANAQSCNNAPHVQPQTSFDWVEENGEAYIQFIANTPNLAISIAWDGGLPTPNNYALWQGNCNMHTTLDTGIFVDAEDQALFYRYSNLIPGEEYLFKFDGTPGSNFVLYGYMIENINPPGTNCNSDTLCNLVTNGGFEDPDNLIVIGNPVGSLTNNTNNAATAFAHEACGWAPAANGSTPDYFLEPADSNYQLGCGTASDIGNSCANFGHNNSDGVMHLFTRDLRQNIGTVDRREYIFSRLNNNIFGNSIFYVNLHVRHRGAREARCSALQILFPESTLDVLNNPATNQQPITIWGTPQVDFSNDINIVAGTNPPWQEVTQIFQFNGVESDAIVIGNFLDNATTDQNFLLPPTNNPQNNLADSISSLFIDGIELIELGNAGVDISMCDIIDTIIGVAPPCLDPDSITYLWTSLTTSQVLGNTVPLNITPDYGTNTYLLTINFRGTVFHDTVHIFVAPQTSVTVINAFACPPPNNFASFILNNVDPALPWTINSSDLKWTNVIFDPSGLLTIDNPVIKSGQGFGTFTFNGWTTIGSIHCPVSFDVIIYDCCLPQQPIDYQFQPGDNMATVFQPLGLTVISGANIGITGNVTANDNYIFLDCNFYFSADSRLEFPSGFVSSITNSTLQPCNEWRWNGLLVHDNATLSIDNSNMWGAIRGIELLNNSNLFAFENIFENNYNHILFSSVTSSSHDIYANDFISEPIGFGNIVQTPNSVVAFASPQNYLTGITLIASSNCTIGVPGQTANRFTTTSPFHTDISNELVYIHPITSQVNIYNNHFGFAKAGIWALSQSNITVGGSPSQANTFNPTFSNANPYSGFGISAKESWGVIEFNSFNTVGTAVSFENCGLLQNGYQQTEVISNFIDASSGIEFASPLVDGSRVRIQNNNITSNYTGIKVVDFTQCDTPQDRVFINGNDIYLKQPVYNADVRKGIILEGSNCVTIGNNSIYTLNNYTPSNPPKTNVIGLQLDNSYSTLMSNQDIDGFDFGLVLENADGSNRFSCTDFLNCFTSVLYSNINDNNDVEPINDFMGGSAGVAASGQVTFTNNIGNERVVIDNCSVGSKSFWNYDGGNNPDPSPASSFGDIFIFPATLATPLTGGCQSLPTFKTNRTKESEKKDFSFKFYPNPNSINEVTVEFSVVGDNSIVRITTLNGFEINRIPIVEKKTIINLNLPSGLYILSIENSNKVYYEKLVIAN